MLRKLCTRRDAARAVKHLEAEALVVCVSLSNSPSRAMCNGRSQLFPPGLMSANRQSTG